jgi:bifunctional non-homologous end joining protein LigD
MQRHEAKASFIPPMLLQRVSSLPDGPQWSYEVKLDGYRVLAVKANGKVLLRSRNNKDFNAKYPSIAKALASLPDETVIDGEVVALDASGRPSFNLLQNVGSSKANLVYYVFDILVLEGKDVMQEPLSVSHDMLRERVLKGLKEPVRESPQLSASLPELVKAVRAHGFEGIVAKRLDGRYEPGQRSGAWLKMRVNQGQEFVIGGYTPGAGSFDALIFGYYEGSNLLYAARTRNGFTPVTRGQLYRRFQGLEIAECPFTNLPESRSGRWGVGLTSEKMEQCRWLKPVLVGQFEYLEWTPDNHLRHARFIGLRDDKNPREVRRES